MELVSHVLILQKKKSSNFYLPVVPSVLPITKDIFFTQKGEEQEKNKEKTLINITTIPHKTRQDKNTLKHKLLESCSYVSMLLK